MLPVCLFLPNTDPIESRDESKDCVDYRVLFRIWP